MSVLGFLMPSVMIVAALGRLLHRASSPGGTQYVKDLSFENPRAPFGLQAGQPRPEIQIQVDVRAAPIGEGQYEVVLDLNVDAKSADEPVFLVELAYGGLFTLANIPADSLQPLLLIECPRLLFPFARRVVADATRDGGFPPLMIDPIDFVTLFRRACSRAARSPRPEAFRRFRSVRRPRAVAPSAMSGTSSYSRSRASAKPAATNCSNSAWQACQ